jgi:hypothetical protein
MPLVQDLDLGIKFGSILNQCVGESYASDDGMGI